MNDVNQVVVAEATEVTPEVVAALGRLLPQLSGADAHLDVGALQEIIAAPATCLLLAREPVGNVVGTATLVAFRIPSGGRARIESLVVDAAARGRGVGQALCQAAIARAQRLGITTIDLTSTPARLAANALYRKLGFVLRSTNIYRLTLGR